MVIGIRGFYEMLLVVLGGIVNKIIINFLYGKLYFSLFEVLVVSIICF